MDELSTPEEQEGQATETALALPRDILLQPRKAAFLRVFARCGSISAACVAAGISRTTFYRWQEEPEFAEVFEGAKQQYIEKLEREVDRRAFVGYDEPVFYQGQVVGHVRKFSDLLAIFRLKSLAPDRYRDNAHITGDGTGPVIVLRPWSVRQLPSEDAPDDNGDA